MPNQELEELREVDELVQQGLLEEHAGIIETLIDSKDYDAAATMLADAKAMLIRGSACYSGIGQGYASFDGNAGAD